MSNVTDSVCEMVLRIKELEEENERLKGRIELATSGSNGEGEPHMGRTEAYEFIIEVLEGCHDGYV